MQNSLTQRSQFLQQKIQQATSQLSHYPPGKLICTYNGTHTRWYINQDGRTTSLPKSERSHAEQLAARKYLSHQLKEFQTEKYLIDSYLNFCSRQQPSDKLLADPRYHDLLAPYFKSEDQYIMQWQSEEFAGNPYHPEQLIYKTPLGYKVRSKSELMISLALYQNHIPHRYECPLVLGSYTIYPDFTILHPQTHELYYLEHFGLMDDPSYAQDASRKLNRYISNNIYPSINLIITSETEAHPLNLDHIEQILRLYF